MDTPRTPLTERRDPCSPVLRLGTELSQARTQGRSGILTVTDRNRSHRLIIARGHISKMDSADTGTLLDQAMTLFALPRPRVEWCNETAESVTPMLDSAALILRGVTTRSDLFDPIQLTERIPLQTLCIPSSVLPRLRALPLTPPQAAFVQRLKMPTPIPLILWKRGLSPDEAAPLLMALNLLGVFQDVWKPGYLPRITLSHRILRMRESGVEDWRLLGISPESDTPEVDRALRRLSMELHPDRTHHLSIAEQDTARTAFDIVLSATTRLKKERLRRRKRPVRDTGCDVLWQRAMEAAECARESGNLRLTRKYALNAMILKPPGFARQRLIELIRLTA